ncbi:MAG: CRISPR-associated helicase Cas3' [bacterium]
MEEVLAKSDGTTLMEHIEDCLVVYSQIQESLPLLPVVTQLDNFWELLFFVIYFHDWGKCHLEFQKALKGIEPHYWNLQRHEIYSIPFLDKLEISEKEKLLVQRAILGHHKPFSLLLEKLKSSEDLKLEWELKWKRNSMYKKAFHPEDFTENLRYNFNYDYLKLLIHRFSAVHEHYTGKPNIKLSGHANLQEQEHPVLKIAQPTHYYSFNPNNTSYWQNLLTMGAAKICDHYGSGKINKLKSFSSKDFAFLSLLQNKLQKEGNDFHYHQYACFNQKGNCILIASTGSGKTEAAIGWLKNHVLDSNGRAYYILPYTASINAMHKRLILNFSKAEGINGHELVGIQHGKLTQYIASLYDEIEEQQTTIFEKNEKINRLRELYRKMIYPIKIITPFQILKYCYGVKGFEMGFTELVGAHLIFDEIHAYDEITFAQLITSIKYFIHYLGCKAMVMTATLPSFMMKELQSALTVQYPVKADDYLLKNFDRHRIIVQDGTIFDRIDEINQGFNRRERIIVVCNTVRNAQLMYELIKQKTKISAMNITLLHGRFNASDRQEKEKKALSEENQILIGTQAIEVSLDIDYDVMFTEPAPLDALLQRFGRVNRRGQKGITPIYISRQGGADDHRIYHAYIVDRTMTLLHQLDIMHETELQDYLNVVYPDWEKDQLVKFRETKKGFLNALKSLQPYERHKENEEEFYERFDGIQVLPGQFLEKYKHFIQQYEFINADKLFVTIHRGMYIKLKKEGLIENHWFAIENKAGKILKRSVTCVQCQYNPEIGMTTDQLDTKIDYSNVM